MKVYFGQCEVTFYPSTSILWGNYTWNAYATGEGKMQSVFLDVKLHL